MSDRSRPARTEVTIVDLAAYHLPPPPRAVVVLGVMFGVFLVTTALGLTFVPWQQTVSGAGRVVAYSPTEREQHLHAPISGRIVEWHVVEGSQVEAGSPIVDLVDVDPDYVVRLEMRKRADRDRIEAARERSRTYQSQADAYERARELKVKAARLAVKMAEQKVAAEEQKVEAARATLATAKANLERTKQLIERGLASTRQLELEQLSVAKAEAELNLSLAGVTEARASMTALDAEALRADAEGGATVASARAEAEKASAEEAYARGDLAKLEVDIARQAARSVVAPVAGTIVKIDGNQGGGIVKEGQQLAVLVPRTRSRAVELYVDGNDAPLVGSGRSVRLQFEGWPAVQFVGWPSVAVGTFGGLVTFVDPASMDGAGRIRVLVQPDPADQPWPPAEQLRQQVRAKAWVLLDPVPLGWELWRRVNGFPPALGAPNGQKNGAPSGGSSDASNGEKAK